MTIRKSKELRRNPRVGERLLATSLLKNGIVVLDDDPIFRARISRFAKSKKIPLTVCGTREELENHREKTDFDVALIDYYLDDNVGSEIAASFGATPVVMMSNLAEECLEENDVWPQTVRTFVNKESGLQSILRIALSVCGRGKSSSPDPTRRQGG